MESPHTTLAHAFAFRYATKVFDPNKQVDVETLHSIIETGRLSPTAYGLQPGRLVHVVDRNLRATIRKDAAFNQAQVTDAAHLFVVTACTDVNEAYIDSYIEHVAAVRGVEVTTLAGFRSTMVRDICGRTKEQRLVWAERQAYIPLGAMITAAAVLGVDACPMEGFVPETVDALLGLEEKHLTSVALFAVGYRGDDAFAHMAKVRLAPEAFVISV